jgi:hypothetical protein
MKKSEKIKHIEKTIKQLSSDPKEADTIKALKKHINGMKPCVHGKYTNEKFTGCKTCGAPKVVICNNKKVVGKKRNSKLCNPAGCKYFESLKLNT